MRLLLTTILLFLFNYVNALADSPSINPLHASIRPILPKEVSTIGQAVEHVLVPFGYQLITNGYAPKESYKLVQQKITFSPEPLTPITIEDYIYHLIGQEYRIVLDTKHQLISFEYYP